MSVGCLVLVFTSIADTVPPSWLATKAVLPSGVTVAHEEGPEPGRPRPFLRLRRLLLAAYSHHGPVIVMYAPVKLLKVSVYLKLSSTRVPPRIKGVQFGFGHTCPTEAGLTDCAGTVSLPFLLEVAVAEEVAVKSVVWDSTTWPPWFLQSTVAE